MAHVSVNLAVHGEIAHGYISCAQFAMIGRKNYVTELVGAGESRYAKIDMEDILPCLLSDPT